MGYVQGTSYSDDAISVGYIAKLELKSFVYCTSLTAYFQSYLIILSCKMCQIFVITANQ